MSILENPIPNEVLDNATSPLTDDRAAYKDSTYEIVSKVAYLIGVPKRIFDNEHEAPKVEVYNRLDSDKTARIIRHLCIVRTAIERNFKRINERMRFQYETILSMPEYVPQESINQLSLFSETTKWKSVRLGDECTFFSGGTPRSTDSSFYGGEIPFIRSGEIHGAKTELFLTDDGLKYSSAKLVSKGDLIVALYGATSGEVDISQIDGAINQAILCIRPKLVNRTFLKYLLEDSKDDILNTYLQGGQGNLSAEIIKNLVFDIPDDRSQSAVVDFLDMIDQRISKSLMKLESIATLRSALMQQLFI